MAMKIILISSILAMTSAGIYGSFDLFHDLKKGKYIKYDRDGSSSKPGSDTNSLYLNDWDHVSTEDYSRGG